MDLSKSMEGGKKCTEARGYRLFSKFCGKHTQNKIKSEPTVHTEYLTTLELHAVCD